MKNIHNNKIKIIRVIMIILDSLESICRLNLILFMTLSSREWGEDYSVKFIRTQVIVTKLSKVAETLNKIKINHILKKLLRNAVGPSGNQALKLFLFLLI